MAGYCTKIRKEHQGKIGVSLILLLVVFLLLSPFGIKTPQAQAEGDKSGYIVIEASSNRVLKCHNEHISMPMASTTKAMTALIVLENARLEDVVTVPQEAVGIEGSSIYLKKGEKISVKDLLYGLMLRSGNDAAVALAIHTAGSVQGFVKLMNDKTEALGLKNTKFQNPHGLSAKGHYTSAYDLAIITSEAFKKPVFKEIVSTKMHTIEGETEEDTRYFANKNRILYSYEGANGVKTGYTTEAGRCLIASSERNGMQVIAVALNYYNYFELCTSLMDYAYENYTLKKVVDSKKCYAELRVKKGGKIKKAELYPAYDKFYPVKKDGSEEIREELSNLKNEIIAPHDKGNSCGELKIYVGNHLIFNEKLYTIYNIEKKFTLPIFRGNNAT